MKRKIILFALVILAFIYGFIIVNPSSTEKIYTPIPTDTTSFMLGAMHNHADYNHTYIDDTFKMNLWHLYTGNQDTVSYKPMGWAASDSLFSDYSNYHSDIEVFLRKFAGQENPSVYMKMLMMRPKIEYLCYGQRSEYQCEPVASGDYYWFYAFQQHLTGIQATDSGKQVMHCRTTPSNPVGDNPG